MPENDELPAALSAELAEKLDRIADLMALTLVRQMEDAEKIRILSVVGYTTTEIADFLAKRPNTISVTLHRQRRKKRARKKPARKKPAAMRGKRR